MKLSAFAMPALPGSGGGMPVQVTIKSNSDYQAIYALAEDIKASLDKTGRFFITKLDMKYDAGKVITTVNRDKAGAYGITMADIANTLSTLLAEQNLGYISVDSRSYKVIPQVERKNRLTPEMLKNYYVRSSQPGFEQAPAITLDNLIDITVTGASPSLKQMDQANAITIGAVPIPTVSLGEAINTVKQAANSILPEGFSYDFKGSSRQFVHEQSSLYISFLLALAIVFLVLSMQFESYRDPLVIMISVPLAMSGALTTMAWGAASLNIYTQVGLLTLMGLITKHGILICEVAKVRQLEHNETRRDAVIYAARIRLRPILMTTLAMMAGVVPLITATGAGAVARMNIGVVIFSGLGFGTLFTLFVLPTVYTFAGTQHKPLQPAPD